jgi:hypothetical protein
MPKNLFPDSNHKATMARERAALRALAAAALVIVALLVTPLFF